MRNLFADFETVYDDEYSLKKMTPIEYILDPRFEALGCAFAFDDNPAFWIDGPDLPSFFAAVDWDDIRTISHNALFDALITSFRYGIRPRKYGCTLSMARNWIAHQIGGVSLANCAKRYGLSVKWDTLARTKGVSFHGMVMNPALHAEVKAYGIDDLEKCRFLYNQFLADGFPPGQLDIIDWVVRMAAQPQLELDGPIVAEHLNEVLARKQQLLDNAGLESRDNLMRDEVLAASLMFFGVDPVPRKISKTTGKEQWAFAKTDKAFTALLEHPSADVQALVAARLGHKSTLEQTRAERLLAISKLTVAFPVPLKYSGAHTHRFSGDWSLNAQNLANGSKLRNAIKAPNGKVVVSVDASQIEARINAEVSGEQWLLDAFREGRDVYAEFAVDIYHRPIVKQLDKVERFVGKTGILSLGYGSSWPVFQNMCRVKGNVALSDVMASSTVQIYRSKCPNIVEHWKVADKQIIPMIANGSNYQWGALTVGRDKLVLPNGNALRYNQLRHEFIERDDKFGWTYVRGSIPHKLYGAKVVENECQALAFIHIEEVAMRVMDLTEGLLWPAHQVHDELIYVVDEHLAELVRDLVVAEMSKSPEWLPNVPLAAEGHIGLSYGDTK
jgi:hypothetical protein